jgi:hypothetical protein
MGSIPVWADPSGPFTEQTDRAGSARSRTQLINPRSTRIDAAPAVTAALRWRGQCQQESSPAFISQRLTPSTEPRKLRSAFEELENDLVNYILTPIRVRRIPYVPNTYCVSRYSREDRFVEEDWDHIAISDSRVEALPLERRPYLIPVVRIQQANYQPARRAKYSEELLGPCSSKIVGFVLLVKKDAGIQRLNTLRNMPSQFSVFTGKGNCEIELVISWGFAKPTVTSKSVPFQVPEKIEKRGILDCEVFRFRVVVKMARTKRFRLNQGS